MRKSVQVLVSAAKDQNEWQSALVVCLPEAAVHVGAHAPDCDYAVLWKPPEQLFARQTRLKAVFALGAGVDNLLTMPGLPADVPLVRMEDVGMAAQMAEYALHAALRRFRGFDHYERAQEAGRWAPRSMRMRADFSVGVLGLGVLGGAVARTLSDYGFDVTGWSRTAKSMPGVRCRHGADALPEVLAHSELLLILLPLTRQTEGLLDGSALARLPRGATLVNLARGALVQDDALLHALDSGQVGEAFLDVFQHEPLPPGHPYWAHPRVRMTPHVGALTPHAVACRQVAEKIRRLESGRPVSGVVDRGRGY